MVAAVSTVAAAVRAPALAPVAPAPAQVVEDKGQTPVEVQDVPEF